MMGVIWLIAIWVAFVGLWGMSKPGSSAATMKHLARELRGAGFRRDRHPFDWSKD